MGTPIAEACPAYEQSELCGVRVLSLAHINMNSTIIKQEDKAVELTITIPSTLVKKTWDEVVDDIAKASDMAGFRKGKAPKKMVEEKIDKDKVREEVLKKLLPQAYSDAIKEHNLQPIVNPKIHIEKFEDPSASSGQADWVFNAQTCEAPTIDLNGYKENVQKITAKSKIVIPGKTQESPKFEDIVKTLHESVKIMVPGIIVEAEVDRLLSQMLDEIKRLGLTLDQYLASSGKTVELLKNEYRQKAENDIKLEFSLQKIAEDEKITVEDKEIEEAINKAKTDEERKNLEANRYLLASIIRQQKTLDFLKNL